MPVLVGISVSYYISVNLIRPICILGKPGKRFKLQLSVNRCVLRKIYTGRLRKMPCFHINQAAFKPPCCHLLSVTSDFNRLMGNSGCFHFLNPCIDCYRMLKPCFFHEVHTVFGIHPAYTVLLRDCIIAFTEIMHMPCRGILKEIQIASYSDISVFIRLS